MSNKQTFYFSLSPVQSFVAEARRTRDLWAGSYVLSYLSGIALCTVKDAGGRILFPAIDHDLMFLALTDSSHPSSDDYKEVGSLPNRFKAEADDPARIAQLATCEIHRAWENIGMVVWNKLASKGIAMNDTIKRIWKRQVANQWEISWAIGDKGYPIEKRKNMRIHLPEDEQGEKCTICGERQALSPSGEDDGRTEVKGWWIREAKRFNAPKKFDGPSGYHFRDDGSERLCAVCTIKRIFPLVTEEAIVSEVNGKGWDVPTKNYPSTPFMAAVPWLISLLRKAKEENAVIKDALKKFVDTAQEKKVQYDEKATVIKTLDGLAEELSLQVISDLRGDVFFEDRVRNEHEFKFSKDENIDKKDREELLNVLDKLYQAADNSKPNPYYALLIMDGDNMGALLSKYKGRQDIISTALSDFNKCIKEIVDASNGKLIYGGGDDVLALLPVETALDCAQKLRQAYITSFRYHIPDLKENEGKISTAIIYSHMTTPFQAVVRDAHRLLDRKAKKETGRDAFAIRVWKRGGPILEFAKKWGHPESNVVKLLEVKKMFLEKEVSIGFIFRFRELLDVMEVMVERDQRIKLLVAEYLKSRDQSEDRERRLRQAPERMGKIYDFSLSAEGKPDTSSLLFIKFLNQMEMNP